MNGPLDTRETITFAHLLRFAVRAAVVSHAAFKHGLTRWATRKWEIGQFKLGVWNGHSFTKTFMQHIPFHRRVLRPRGMVVSIALLVSTQTRRNLDRNVVDEDGLIRLSRQWDG